jgi:hypothetical protein
VNGCKLVPASKARGGAAEGRSVALGGTVARTTLSRDRKGVQVVIQSNAAILCEQRHFSVYITKCMHRPADLLMRPDCAPTMCNCTMTGCADGPFRR